jgi:hypothetical protein
VSPEHEPVPADVYLRVFGNPSGEAVLEELTAVFCRAAVTTGGIDAILETYRRAGTRQVVEFLLDRINSAHEARHERSDPDPDA